METMKRQAIEIFDLLPRQEQVLIFELMRRLVPDDVATPDDLVAHEIAMEEYRRGETIGHDEINWD